MSGSVRKQQRTAGAHDFGTLAVGQCATLACLLDVTAPKPGNVHRGADFDDVTFWDFAASAAAIGPVMECAPRWGVGRTVLAAVEATQRLVASNTNLGIALLLAPLAAVPRGTPLPDGTGAILASLSTEDAQLVYDAIRLAQPGGLGRSARMDVAGSAPVRLIEAMREAADRDRVARQYVENFADVFQLAAPWILGGCREGLLLIPSIIHTHVRLMAEFPDSLIARKCGPETAGRAQAMARAVLDSGPPFCHDYQSRLADLDFWLRSDGHRRNPGTTADLVTAGLFVLLREEMIEPPFASFGAGAVVGEDSP